MRSADIHMPATQGEGSGGRDAVILLHGLARTNRSMGALARFLQARGFLVCNLNYPSTQMSVEQLADNYLAKAVEEISSQCCRIHLVSHSLGGIVIRYYVSRHDCRKLSRVVMLAPPNRGCELIDSFRRLALFNSIAGPAATQLATDSRFLAELPKCGGVEIGVIAGCWSWNPWFSWLVPGADDGKVSVVRTQLDEMKDHLVVRSSHLFVMRHKGVHEQTLAFLESGAFSNRSKKLADMI